VVRPDGTIFGPTVAKSPNAGRSDRLSGHMLARRHVAIGGTWDDQALEVFGAPWIEPARLRLELDKRRLPGVVFRETWFTPVFDKHVGERCGGLQIHVSDRRVLKPVLMGVHILDAARRLWPEQTYWTGDDSDQPWIDRLFATDGLRLALDAGVAPGEIARQWEPDERRFRRERRAWMLYD
jgi:uncharacterized protein YbbC (DUF1343 family)